MSDQKNRLDDGMLQDIFNNGMSWNRLRASKIIGEIEI